MRRGVAILAASALLSAAASSLVPAVAVAAAPATFRVSIGAGGVEADGASKVADVSGDGRYVVFGSAAASLVPGDTNGVSDIFVRDRATGTTTRVSVSSAGAQASLASDSATISADGRWVVFASAAPDLVAGDTNGHRDVFLRDRDTLATRRVSLTSAGAQAFGHSHSPRISADGRYVAFFTFSDLANTGAAQPSVNAYRVDLSTGEVVDLCRRDNGQLIRLCLGPAISADGRYVAFEAQGALAADDTNGWPDVYVRDMATGIATRASVSSGGAQGNAQSQGPSISADGRVVAFTSWASTLVPGDTGAVDVFVRDLAAGTTERVSVGSGGAQPTGNSFLRPFNTGSGALSGDGRFVAFHSFATNLVSAADVNGVNDVFVRDRASGTTVMASLGADGRQATGPSTNASISADGRFVTFESLAADLVAGDTNGASDVFIADLRPNTPPTLTLPADARVYLADGLSAAGSFADPDLDQSWSGTVTYGDGSAPVALAIAPDKTFALAHAYADLGIYTVEVALSDGAGGTAQGTFTVDVQPTPLTYAAKKAGLTIRVQLDERAADHGRVWVAVPGVGTYVLDAALSLRSTGPSVVQIDFAGPALLTSADGTTSLTVALRGRVDPARHVAEVTLEDSAGRRLQIVATP